MLAFAVTLHSVIYSVLRCCAERVMKSQRGLTAAVQKIFAVRVLLYMRSAWLPDTSIEHRTHLSMLLTR